MRAVVWTICSVKTRRSGRPVAPHLPRAVFSALGPVFPRLLGSWAYRLWFRTRREVVPAAELSLAGAAEHLTLAVDGLPLAIYRWGAGPIILFMHGWSGRATHVRAFVEPLTAAGYCVLAFDAPAHGNTPGRRTNLLEISAALCAIADAYGPLHGAIAHSFGGMVLAYALHHGLDVHRVVCIATPARLEFLLERFTRLLALSDPVRQDLRRRLEKRFAENVWELLSADRNARTLNVPALIVHDRDDRDVPWTQGALIAEAWPGAQWLATQGLGHRRILRDAGTVQAIVDFLCT